MNERHHGRRQHVSTRDRQILVTAYLPVIAFGAALIAARISRTRRRAVRAGLR